MKLLLRRLIPVRQVRFPIEGGMEPVNFLAVKFKTMTRVLEGLHVTPNQLQKCVEPFQELMI